MAQNQLAEYQSRQEKRQSRHKKIPLKKVANQVIVITGATSGIGLSTARMAAAKGAAVVLAARNEEALQEITNELREQGASAVWVKADVSREEEVKQILATALEQFGRVDTWVNNAGIAMFGEADEVSIEDLRSLFETNFWGAVYGSRTALQYFKEQRSAGALINMGSAYGDMGVVLQSGYSAAKHALHGWTKSLRTEMEAKGLPVSVTLINPGKIDTPVNEHAASYMKHQPAHRELTYPPKTAAEAVLHAAEHPKKIIYVGSQARLVGLLENGAPNLSDKLIALLMSRTQHADKPSQAKENNALYRAGTGQKEHGEHPGLKRSTSWYTKASKHPVLTYLAFAGAVCGALWTFLSKKR
ncbi:SDR family oxidoreductase [Alkalicoccus daliensis]|uniref:Short-chain dehydrogenase n=1 Tax=Alkalicoccus daliensis TaxID=745820 RepID=A0A1H0HR94_9BACI|nr:SDR family oxidoreductase [Alkalicoccus daliensis]SDO21657.1 Short-chain dehydrogenase [Alkalicoccus daliensis]